MTVMTSVASFGDITSQTYNTNQYNVFACISNYFGVHQGLEPPFLLTGWILLNLVWILLNLVESCWILLNLVDLWRGSHLLHEFSAAHGASRCFVGISRSPGFCLGGLTSSHEWRLHLSHRSLLRATRSGYVGSHQAEWRKALGPLVQLPGKVLCKWRLSLFRAWELGGYGMLKLTQSELREFQPWKQVW